MNKLLIICRYIYEATVFIVALLLSSGEIDVLCRLPHRGINREGRGSNSAKATLSKGPFFRMGFCSILVGRHKSAENRQEMSRQIITPLEKCEKVSYTVYITP